MNIPQPIIKHFGGCELYIPKNPTPKFIELLGIETATAFCQRHMGETLYIPNQRQAKILARQKAIVSHYHTLDMTPTQARRETALMFGVSEKWVKILVSRY